MLFRPSRFWKRVLRSDTLQRPIQKQYNRLLSSVQALLERSGRSHRKRSHFRRSSCLRPSMTHPELLEDRALLSVSTPVLGSSNDVVLIGDGAVDSIEVSASSGGLLEHNLGGSFGFNSNRDLDSVTPGDQVRLINDLTSVTYTDAGTNDAVAFAGVMSFADADLSVTADTIQVNAAITTGGGDVALTATDDITLKSSVTTGGGAFVANADSDQSGNGEFSLVESAMVGLQQQQKLTAADAAAGDEFGYTAAIDGDTAIVGAYLADHGGNGEGSAYVFTRASGVWTQQQELTAFDAASLDRFGKSVAIHGNTAVVSAHSDDDDGTNSGSVYIFTRTGNTWSFQQKVTASDAETLDNFGHSVSVFGDTVVVGSRYDDDAGDKSGSAYVFTRSGSTWTEQQKLTASDAAADDQFGWSVALSSNTAIVGAFGNDDAGSESGSAYVFVRSGNTWTEQSKLTASNAAVGDQFGISVALAGDTAIVGSPLRDGAGADSGQAHIFTRSGSTWTEQQKLIALDAAAGDLFGHSVSISGDTAVVGAKGVGSAAGAAYIFTRSGNTWTQQDKLAASNAAAADEFGNSVAVSGGTVLVGANLADAGGADSGTASLFEQSEGSISTGSGAISITADTVNIQGTIAGTSTLQFKPSQATSTIGIGSGSGSFLLDDTELGNLVDGFSSLTIGNAVSGSGNVNIDTATFAADVTVAGGTILVKSTLSLGDRNLTLLGDTIIVKFGRSISSGDGTISLTADRNIVLESGTSLTTIDGGIALSANANGTAIGDFDGLEADNATIASSGTGNISLIGGGGDDLSTGSHYGVYFHSGTSLSSTSNGASAGKITIDGTGGDGTSNSRGVHFTGSGAGPYVSVASVNGDISIAGQGGDGTGNGNWGIQMSNVETISSTGTGADAAKITIDGTGGVGGSSNLGVYLAGTMTDITSVDGDISIIGQGGGSETGQGSNPGVSTFSFGSISSTGTGPDAATISLNGTGGVGYSSNTGISLRSGIDIDSVDGAIAITGEGGSGGGRDNKGVYIDGSTTLSSIGTGVNAAPITVLGTGGDGGEIAYGTHLFGTFTSVDGDISITGQGGHGSTKGYNTGVVLGSATSSTGTGATAAMITINGTGGAGTHDNRGVSLGGPVASVDGAVSITGVGGNGSSSGNDGIYSSAALTSTGAGETAATITIDGTGGAGGGTGLSVEGTAGLTSVDGAIWLIGQGGNGSFDDNRGVSLVDVETIASTGIGTNAATITIDGTGGAGAADNYGVYVEGATTDVTTVDGAILITGQGGGDGSDRYNYGVYVNSSESISSTGTTTNAASITIDGTGGNGTTSNDGVYVKGTSTVLTSVTGDILVTGQGSNGTGVRLTHGLTSSTGIAADAATITITSAGSGSGGGVGGGTLTSVFGDISVIGGTDSNAGATLATSTGTGANAARVTISHTGNGGTISGSAASVDGDIRIAGGNASFTISGDISSTGTGADAATITVIGGYVQGVGSDITSVDGDISVTGTGRSISNVGLLFRDSTISSTGTDTNAAAISIIGTGTGSDAAARSDGVILRDMTLTSVIGAISITGQGGGAGSSGASAGVYLDDAILTSDGTEANAATITINGTGGNGSTHNHGVRITGSDSAINSVIGDISITGRAGDGTGDDNHGVDMGGLDTISSTGTGPGAATITIDGTGGDGTDHNFGIYSADSAVTSVDGAISFTGIGGDGTSVNNYGVRFVGGNQISSTGTGVDAATITIDGTGGNSGDHNYGVEVRNSTSITSIDGDIAITGQGGSGGWGIGTALNAANISSTGTGVDSALVTIVGTGGTGGTNNRGVNLGGSTTVLTSVDGDISITGQGGDGSVGYGIYAFNSGTISSTGTGPHAASISLHATATTNRALYFSSGPHELTSVDGDIDLFGQTASGTDVYLPSIVGGPTTTGDITIIADTLSFSSTTNVQSTGDLTFQPRTTSTDIGIGGGTVGLRVYDTDLGKLADGFSSITIGDVANGTGPVNIQTATFTDPVIIAGGTINDNPGTDIDAGINSVTLVGDVSPGQSPGVLEVSGNFVFADDDSFDVEIGGTSSGNTVTDHDQLDVTGTVTIGADVTLNVSGFGGFTPVLGQQYVIVNNDGTDAINGTFAGLAEGALMTEFPGSGLSTSISYLGIDAATGNDVVLTVLPTVMTLHWQGDVDNNWSTPGNWLEDQAPRDGDSVIFDTVTTGFAGNFAAANDLTNLLLGSLVFVDNSANGNFSISGNAIALDADDDDAITSNAPVTVGIGISLQSPATISGRVNLTGDINTNSHLLTIDTDTVSTIAGTISGLGGLNKIGIGQVSLHGSNDYEGISLIEDGGVVLQNVDGLGKSSGETIVSAGGWVMLNSFSTDEPITAEGAGVVGGALGGAGTAEYSGPVTLSGDTTLFVSNSGSVLTFRGGITGPGHDMNIQTFGDVSRTLILDGTNTYTGNTTLLGAGTLLVNGSLAPESSVAIPSGGVLGGTGTIQGSVNLGSGATLAPGSSTGVLGTGNVSFTSGSTLEVELNGTTAGSDHDQLDVTGTVVLDGTTLSATLAFVPVPGDELVIINNDGSDAVSGAFDGLAEGATITLGGEELVISYQAGDGNDVAIKAKVHVYDFEVPVFAAPEGNVTNTDIAITVTRSGVIDIGTSLDLILTDGTATAGSDYAAGPITFGFAPGETSRTVPIDLFGDLAVEPDETILLSFANFSDAGEAGTVYPTATFVLANDDHAPAADAGGTYTIDEGGSLQLTAIDTVDLDGDSLTFRWDVDGDGDYDENISGVTPAILTTPQLANLGLVEGPYSGTITVEANDGTNVSTASTTLTIDNVAPVINSQVDEQLIAYDWASLIREVPFVDSGVLDQHDVTIDFGDGSPVQQLTLPIGERSVTLDHAYAVTSGATTDYTVSVLVSDDDGDAESRSFIVEVADRTLTEPDLRPTVDFAASTYSVTEGGGEIVLVEALLSAPATEVIEVPLVLAAGTASRDVDYLLEDTLFVFAVGDTRSQLTLTDVNDSIEESPVETATLSLASNLTGVLAGTMTTTELKIQDNDQLPVVYFEQARSVLSEGTNYQLTVRLTSLSLTDVIVPLYGYGVNSSDATDDDFALTLDGQTIPAGDSSNLVTLTIPAGDESGSVTLTITDDDTIENTENFVFVFLSGIVGAESRYKPGTNRRHITSVPANDTNVVEISSSKYSITEGDGSFTVTAKLDIAAGSDYSIPFVFSGSAGHPSDYTTSPSSITIPAGQSQATMTVTITDDTLPESSESLNIRLGSNLPGGVIAGTNRSINITVKDDDAPQFSFTKSRQSVWENEGPVTITVSTGGVTFANTVSIPISVNGGSDLGSVPTQIDISPGSTQGSATIGVVNDSKNEPDESFTIKLGSLPNVPNAKYGKNKVQTLTIKDNDPLATISVNESSVSETNGTVVKFTVQLSAVTNKKVRIPFVNSGVAKRDTSEEHDTDKTDYYIVETTQPNYMVSSNYVDINAGKSRAIITVKIKGDNLSEGAERVKLTLKQNYGSYLLNNALLDPEIPQKDTSASFVIKASDGTPVVLLENSGVKARLHSPKFSTTKTTSEGGEFEITVTLNNPSSRSIYVPITFPTGSGRASSNDFTVSGLSKGKLKIPAGKTSAKFLIHLTDDSRDENKEIIRIQLKQPVDYKGDKYGMLSKYGNKRYGDVTIRASDQTSACNTGNGQAGNILVNPSLCTTGASSVGSSVAAPAGGTSPFILTSGYREGSTVFVDANFNGVRDFIDYNGDDIQGEDEPTEPLATTFADGSFNIFISDDFDLNENGVLDLEEGQIVAVGGVDTSTGMTQDARLIAASGDFVVTPLTTLSAKLVQQQDWTLDEAHDRVLDALSLDFFDMGHTAVLNATLLGDQTAAASYPATVALETSVVVIAHYLQGTVGVEVETGADLIYEQLARVVALDGAILDLSDVDVLESIVVGAVSQFGPADYDANTAALAEALAAVNVSTLELPVSLDLSFLDAVVRRKIVARGDMATDAEALAAGTLNIVDFQSRFASQSLQDKIDAAQSESIVPVAVAVSDAEIVEGDNGSTFAEFQVAISSHFAETVSVDYMTQAETANDDPANGAQDFQAVSGTLTWNPGDDNTKTIQVPVVGDTLPELDETFLLTLVNTNADIIRRGIGRGYIRADDAVFVQLNATTDVSDVIIGVDNGSVSVYQDGESMLDGLLNPDAPLEIQGATGSTTNFRIEHLQETTSSRTITVRGGSSNDTIYFDNSVASSSEHQILDDESGRFEAAGLVVDYLKFLQTDDARSPSLQFSGIEAIGETIRIDSEPPEEVDTNEALFAWTVTRNGTNFATGTDDFIEFIPDDSGEYEVVLQLTMLDDSTSLVHQTVTLENVAPTVVIQPISEPRFEGTAIEVISLATDPAGVDDTLTYSYNVLKDGVSFATATGVDLTNFTFTPNDNGTFTISLNVSDQDGGSASATQTITVDNVAPTPSIDSISAAPLEGTSIDFNGAATDPAGTNDTLTYVWDFGDNSPVDNGAAVSHTFEDDGTFIITLTVNDEDGGSASATQAITVDNVAPSIAAIDAAIVVDEADAASNSGTFSDPGADGVTLTASPGTVVDNLDGTWSWSWDTSDGPDDSQTVTITATDSDHAATSVDFALTVNNVAPTLTGASSTADDFDSRSADGTVTLNGAFVDPGLDTHDVVVDWGDGTVEHVAVDQLADTFAGSHLYINGGIYTVIVTTTDSDGAVSAPLITQSVVEGVGLVNGTLFILGTDGLDWIRVTQDEDTFHVSAWLNKQGWFRYKDYSHTHFNSADVSEIVTMVGGQSDVVEVSAEPAISVYVDGGTGNDWIHTAGGNDTIFGGDGNDRIVTNGGHDTIDAGAGDNWIHAGDGQNEITAGSGSDIIHSGDGRDTIDAGDGHNVIYSGGGNDTITTGDGADWVESGDGADEIRTGAGSDWIDAGNGHDIVFAGSGNDRIDGGRGRDILFGGSGNDIVEGGFGRDILIGGDGRDRIYGGRGDDLLIGGQLETDWESLFDADAADTLIALDNAMAEWATGRAIAR